MKHPSAVTNTPGNTPSTSAEPPGNTPEQIVLEIKELEMSEGQPRPRLEVYYIVLRPFKYNGAFCKAGEEWMPLGKPFDGKIINSGRHVKRVEKVIVEAEAARRKPKPKEEEEDGE